MFSETQQHALKEELLPSLQAKEGALLFPVFRATRHLLARSHLEMITGSDFCKKGL
jgi:hypothetical protein